MDLKQRLARLDRLARRRRAAGDETTGGGADADVLEGVCRELGLAEESRGEGILWLRDHPPRSAPPAPAALEPLAGVFSRPLPPGLRAGDLLFLDTETTGLAGGTGSLAFLVGCAWWEEGGFRVRQLFLPGPGREAPFLAALAELAAGFRAVVSFNGNVFDLPLLRTRARLARRPDPCRGLAQLDLLPVARRLWGRRLADCRQQTLEREICGRPRGPGDIDGGRIPQAYFDYLSEGRPGLLPHVLRHNRRDMEGMAHILDRAAARAADLLRGPDEAADDALAWQDAWANGRLCEGMGRQRRAAGWLTAALAGAGWAPGGALPAAVPEACCADAVRLLKRRRDWSRVEALLRTALERYGDRPWLHREAAILFEHRLGRLREALRHAERLGDPVRLARLRRKLGRDSA